MPDLQSKSTQAEFPSVGGSARDSAFPAQQEDNGEACSPSRAPNLTAIAFDGFDELSPCLVDGDHVASGEICCPIHGWTNLCAVGHCRGA